MKTANLSIGDYGCLLTSFTMVADILAGSFDDPGEVNIEMGNYACDFYWYTAAIYNMVVAAIKDDDRPVIVGVTKGSSHYVLARGYSINSDSEITIYIYDPWLGRNYYTLSQYELNGWTYGDARVGIYK